MRYVGYIGLWCPSKHDTLTQMVEWASVVDGVIVCYQSSQYHE